MDVVARVVAVAVVVAALVAVAVLVALAGEWDRQADRRNTREQSS